MKIENEFIPYKQALALKELGFDEPCLAFYSPKEELHPVFQEPLKGPYFNNGSFIETLRAPLYQQAFRWFREKYVLDSIVQPTYSTKYQYRVFNIETKSKVQVYRDYMGKEFKTYEEAELDCLKKLIEIVKNK